MLLAGFEPAIPANVSLFQDNTFAKSQYGGLKPSGEPTHLLGLTRTTGRKIRVRQK